MQLDLKDLITWAAMALAMVAQWFHLKSRVAILETKHNMATRHHEDTLGRIDRKLDRIEQKLDDKADKR